MFCLNFSATLEHIPEKTAQQIAWNMKIKFKTTFSFEKKNTFVITNLFTNISVVEIKEPDIS